MDLVAISQCQLQGTLGSNCLSYFGDRDASSTEYTSQHQNGVADDKVRPEEHETGGHDHRSEDGEKPCGRQPLTAGDEPQRAQECNENASAVQDEFELLNPFVSVDITFGRSWSQSFRPRGHGADPNARSRRR